MTYRVTLGKSLALYFSSLYTDGPGADSLCPRTVPWACKVYTGSTCATAYCNMFTPCRLTTLVPAEHVHMGMNVQMCVGFV